jgi:histidyl-tRNA synthetase
MKITTVKGTNDYLPKEVLLRDYMTSAILEVYRKHGFERITTPIIEDIENLNKSEGGENLGLIFKILKRGDKLEKALEECNYDELTDLGLRYDLTLPLSRYYANNRSNLILPFRCIQIDKVYRAERPQKGRMREFVQCDIDILGTSSPCAEVELITTTAEALLTIGIEDFKVKVNDRRILRDFILSTGYQENELEMVCIILDKLDKIGPDGVLEELNDKGYSAACNTKLHQVLKEGPITFVTMKSICKEKNVIENLEYIIQTAERIANQRYAIEYDMSLVRGQGYYTGTVFEIESLRYRGSVAGGGRYDNLIGKFINETVPAVGFSIGFERIYQILMESKYEIKNTRKRVVCIYEQDNFADALLTARDLRKEYEVALYERPKKLGNFLTKLQQQGYWAYFIQGQSEELNILS